MEHNPDKDQMVSARLLAAPPHHPKAASVPTPFVDPFFGTSVPQSLSTETEVSASPAAMFLSVFSPVTASQALPDDEGEVVAGYTLGPIIGHGAFSVVRRAASPQGDLVAVKIVRRSDLDKQEDPQRARATLDHESSVWSALSHEHILPLFTSSHTPHADFFVTLYCPAGSLFDILQRDGRPALPQDEAGRMFRQVVKGVRYMHEIAGYVHRDLKLENVLVDEMGVCRIGDFGMAKRIGEWDEDEEDRHSPRRDRSKSRSLRQKRSRSRQPTAMAGLTTHLSMLRHHSGPRHRNSSPLPAAGSVPQKSPFQPGSLPYASPEILMPSGSATSHRVHTAQDVWALGVMLYVMLTGQLPFADSFEPRLQMKILAGTYCNSIRDFVSSRAVAPIGSFEMPGGIGRGAERVLSGCLERSVQDRWTVAMVDEVAWGIGWGDAGDEAPSPTDMLPPARSRSQSRPLPVSDDCAVEDADFVSPVMDRSTSRSRHSRSRSRLAGFHPYQHQSPHHHFAPYHDHPPPSGLHSSILRSISTSSESSTFSPVESPISVGPSPSVERGRRTILHHEPAAVASTSRSPSEVPPTPIDIDRALASRGRKASRAVVSPLSLAPFGIVDASEHEWVTSPDIPEESLRSASVSRLMAEPSVRHPSADPPFKGARTGSVPPYAAWPGQQFKSGSPASATPISVHGQTTSLRSRSVGFEEALRSQSRS